MIKHKDNWQQVKMGMMKHNVNAVKHDPQVQENDLQYFSLSSKHQQNGISVSNIESSMENMKDCYLY